MLTPIALRVLITFSFLLTIYGQVLRKQAVLDSQQVQVPVRRINIPVDLKNTGSNDRTDTKLSSPEKNCPKCLEKRLVLHYMSRGCTPVIKGGCDCPNRYECPSSERLISRTNFNREAKSLDRQTNVCSHIDCRLDSDPKFQMGCTPVYDNDQCCPVRYICPKRNPLRVIGVENGSLLCEFEGRKYPIDSKLYTDERCVDCVCRIPPQFTCIKKKYCS